MNGFREWLNTLFGSDGGRAVQMVVALAVVVLLLLAITWLFRRLFSGAFPRGRSTRLAVLDSTAVDHNRRLLLVRRDDVEHLVMIGGPNDLLVESRILRGVPVVAGRGAPVARIQPAPVATPRPEAVAAEPPPRDVPTPPTSEAPTDRPAAARMRTLPGAAAVAAAVAGAGAFVRARAGRAETAEPEPAAEPAPPRRTFDTAFDEPLGRPEVAEAPAPRRPLPPETPPAPVMPAPVKSTPVVAAPVVSAPMMPAPAVAAAPEPVTVERAERAELADRIERALGDAVEPARAPAPTRPIPHSLDDIDLLADFDAVAAELSRPVPPPTGPLPAFVPPPATPVPREPVFVEPIAVPPRRDREVSPPPPEPPVVAPEPVVEPRFQFVDEIEVPTESPSHDEVAPPEPPQTDRTEPFFDFDLDEPSEPEATVVAAHAPVSWDVAPPRPGDEPAVAAETDREPEATIEFDFDPAAAEPEPVAEPVAEAAPEPAPAPRSPIDELEEEMARLLSELSGQTRR